MRTTLSVLVVAGLATGAAAQQIVVPNSAAGVEGGSNNSFPFTNTIAAQRYQQIYAAGEFTALSGPAQVTELRFRPNADSTFTPWSNTVTLDVKLSTTQAAPDQLSVTWDDNVGPDEKVVYSGPATLATGQSGPATGPLDFDIVLTLQMPFVYNPANGNLLMEVFRDGTTLPGSRYLDAVSDAGDGVSRLYTNSSTPPTSPTGIANTLGLVTLFVFEPVAGGCYANCDQSTSPPVLNVSDFGCFLSKFASGDPYANCDQSTAMPVLNVSDFGCFLTKFAAGCR